jgi:site-specific DNA recombinase
MMVSLNGGDLNHLLMSHLPPPSTLPPGSVVDAYVRDSGGPRQDASTDQQLTEIASFCLQHGIILRHKFADVAKSGGSTVGRDDFNRMVDLTRRPEDRPQGLLLWNYARFARDLDDAIYYKAVLRQRGIVIHSLTDPVPEGQYGRIIEFFIDISNEEKRRQTSADAKRGLRDLVTSHGCMPGLPPRGFIRQPVTIGARRDGSPHIAHRWVPDPALRARVQKAFEMRAGGSTLAQIHSELHLYLGLNSYKTFFTNRLYIGILEFGDLVIDEYCEPLIPMATWNAVQKHIQEHARAKFDRLHPRRFNSPYMLSGLVYCGECGAPMSANTVTGGQRGRDEAYRCSRSKRRAGCTQGRISRRRLEEAVLTTLRDYILLPDSLAALYEIEQHASNQHEDRRLQRLSTLQDDRRKLSGQIANITRAIAERGHSQSLLDKLTELETPRAQAIAEIHELEGQHFAPGPLLTQADILRLSQTLTEKLTHAPTDQVRQMLLGFIHKVVVKKENKQIIGSITYFTPPCQSPPFENPLPQGAGYNLPLGSDSTGAPLYRQIFNHPILFKKTGSQ